jgi:hypothetical protein
MDTNVSDGREAMDRIADSGAGHFSEDVSIVVLWRPTLSRNLSAALCNNVQFCPRLLALTHGG